MEQQMATGAAAHRHKHGRKPISQKVVTSIIDGLKQIYFHKVCVDLAAIFTMRPCLRSAVVRFTGRLLCVWGGGAACMDMVASQELV
jgi:hypothetical protein